MPRDTKKTRRAATRSTSAPSARAHAPAQSADIAALMRQGPQALLTFLEQSWPEEPAQSVIAAFSLLRDVLNQEQSLQDFDAEKTAVLPDGVNILILLREVLAERDHQFLKRQQTYHVAADSTLPLLHVDAAAMRFVLARLVDFVTERAPVKGRLEIAVQEEDLRGSGGVKIVYSYKDPALKGADQSAVLRDLHLSGSGKDSAGVLASCRQLIVSQHGQLAVNVVGNRVVEYVIALPTQRPTSALGSAANQTFQYRITIANYSLLRKSYGIKKAAALVHQVENYVKALVRTPLDVVLCVPEKGEITTIYETQHGAGASVATRISQRLAKETFRVGKKPVEMSFRYHLELAPAATAA